MADVILLNGTGQEELFTNQFATWNVTKALLDASNGMFGAPHTVSVADLMDNNRKVEVDLRVVKRKIKKMRKTGAMVPLLGMTVRGGVYLADGHHRLRALDLMGWQRAPMWIVPEALEQFYRVKANGLDVAFDETGQLMSVERPNFGA